MTTGEPTIARDHERDLDPAAGSARRCEDEPRSDARERCVRANGAPLPASEPSAPSAPNEPSEPPHRAHDAPDPPADPDHEERGADPSASRLRGVHGSRFDQAYERPPARGLLKRARRGLAQVAIALLARVVPYVYYAYCWLVWRTSRVEDGMTPVLGPALDRHDRFVGLLWHQEVFTVAYAYRHLKPHTLASIADFGRIITAMLELCGFTVFRGGSSARRTRRREVLPDMIEHMRAHPRVCYGITVDGARGPAFRMKKGGAVIGRTCRAPIYIVRTWFSRCIQAPTWDRTAIPLPFGRVQIWAVGPYWIDPEGSGADFEAACRHLENELLDLAQVSFRELGPRGARALGAIEDAFPPGWRPRWTAGRLGIPRGPHDLRPDDPPPWAHRPVETAPPG